MSDKIHVYATCEDEQGGGDAAYSLCGDYTPEEFCAELLKTLKEGWGLTNAQGKVTLSIHITEPDTTDADPR